MQEKMIRVNVTLHRDILQRIDEYAKKNLEDRSTAMRQLVSKGLMEENRREVTNAYREKRITLREAAELYKTDYYGIQDILAEEGIPVSDLKPAETEERITKTKRDKY